MKRSKNQLLSYALLVVLLGHFKANGFYFDHDHIKDEKPVITSVDIFFNDTLNDSQTQFPQRFWTIVNLADKTDFRLEFDLIDNLGSTNQNESLKLWISDSNGKSFREHLPSDLNRHVSSIVLLF